MAKYQQHSPRRPRWQWQCWLGLASQWFQRQQRRYRACVTSTWWATGPTWQELVNATQAFLQGEYHFLPLVQYRLPHDVLRVWSHLDRWVIHLFHQLLKPTFSYLISKRCFHLQGPGGVKSALRVIEHALQATSFPYVIRLDIKSYYASLSYAVLLDQVEHAFADPRARRYLEEIITIPIDDGGHVWLPQKGIPRSSSLSPFLGALYLSPLDRAFENATGMVYVRYMDDIVILCQTKRHYRRARKRLFRILSELQLVVSPRKTRMGRLRAFHFLGVQFESPQRAQTQSKPHVSITIHPRSCRRALDRVQTLRHDAVHAATIQRYLVRWAAWWADTMRPLTFHHLLLAWVLQTYGHDPTCAWLGRGLLPLRMACANVMQTQ